MSELEKEKRKLYMREYYARNRDKLLAAAREQKRDHSAAYQRRKEYMKRWHQENKDHVRAKKAIYLAIPENRARRDAYLYAWRQTGAHLITRAKIRAKAKGWEFDLTISWINAKMAAGVCELSGLPFTPRGKKGPCAPSLDRRDSSKGYTQDNCRVIAWALNAAFNDWGEQAAREVWAAYLTRNPG